MFVGDAEEVGTTVGEDGLEESKPISLAFGDEDIVFEDPTRVEYLGDMSVLKFGCVQKDDTSLSRLRCSQFK